MFDGLILPPGVRAAGTRWELDPLDPINRNLLRKMPLDEPGGGILRDLSPSNARGSTVGAVTRPTTPYGRAIGFSATTTYGKISDRKTISGKVNWTVSFWVQTAVGFNIPPGAAFYCERAPSGNDAVKVEGGGQSYTLNKVFFSLRDDGGTLKQAAGTSIINDGGWHHCLMIKQGAILRYYVDDVLEIDTTWTGTDNFTNSGIQTRICSDAGDASPYLNGAMQWLNVYDRVLARNEITRLFREPHAGTIDPAERLFFAMRGAASVPFTATPGPGTLTLQGHAPSLSAGATLAAGYGTLTLQGQAPSLSAGATLAAGYGTLTIQGQSPSLSAGATLAAGFGTLTLQGQAPSLSAGATLAAGYGTLTIQGQSPSLSAGATLAAGYGTITLQGHAARLRAPLGIAAPERTVTWSVQSRAVVWAETDRALTWPADSRSIRWTG